MDLFSDEDPESFARFFPDLGDVEIQVRQLDGEGQALRGTWLLTGAGFPDAWLLVCGEPSCHGVFDVRGALYGLLHGQEDAGEGVERCRGRGPGVKGKYGAGECPRSWQFSIRLRRKPDTGGEDEEASRDRAEPPKAPR